MKNYLKRIVIRTFDDEYGVWNIYSNDMIITESNNNETYIGSSKIFDVYQELLDEHHRKMSKYPTIKSLKFEKPILEIDTLVKIDADDLETTKRIMQIDGTSKYIKSVYIRVQHYGGAEEGGWYYYTLHLVSDDIDESEIKTDRYGEGFVKYSEFYKGQNENTERQFYC